MRLGGIIVDQWNSPEEWAQKALDLGYRAVYFPVDHMADTGLIDAYVETARSADLVIAEVGAWSNPMSRDSAQRDQAFRRCVHQLELADYVGARCCVNIAGSMGEQWDGHHRDNYTQATFDAIVETTQKIIDQVKPQRTYYTLEPMPWMVPDSADAYLKLIQQVDRTHFAAHLDPVNMITSPYVYYHNGDLIRECFDKLGPYIRSCHAKDIRLGQHLTVHLDECCPGDGMLDYMTYLKELDKMDDDMPLMLEHMEDAQDYTRGMAYIQSINI